MYADDAASAAADAVKKAAAKKAEEAAEAPHKVPRHLSSDLMRLAVMEILSLVALRLVIEQLFGIDIFDFHTALGKLTAAVITTTVFVGLYKAISIDGKLQEIGESVIHGHGVVSLSD